MASKKKSTAATRSASVLTAISSAEKSAAQAFAAWGKAVEKAIATTEKNLVGATKKATSVRARAGKALLRVRKAKGASAKANARNARKGVLANVAAANATLDAARESHAASKAAQKLYQLIEKSMAGGIKLAEKAAAKAAKPRKRRRRKARSA
jgi:hypothetical protein